MDSSVAWVVRSPTTRSGTVSAPPDSGQQRLAALATLAGKISAAQPLPPAEASEQQPFPSAAHGMTGGDAATPPRRRSRSREVSQRLVSVAAMPLDGGGSAPGWETGLTAVSASPLASDRSGSTFARGAHLDELLTLPNAIACLDELLL